VKRAFFFALLIAVACGISCSKGLKTSGYVRFVAQSQDKALQDAASRLHGMRLIQETDNRYWSNVLKEDMDGGNPHDLVAVDWGRELLSARNDGELASLKNIWAKTAASRRMPAFSSSILPSPADGFIPSAIYTWGLFYNRRLLSGLGSGKIGDMDSFVSVLIRAKAKGIVPISLGASNGLAGAAWLVYLDLRMNGGKAAWERIMGKRPFDDATGTDAANVLAAWRDAGFFAPDAGPSGAKDSGALLKGDALFMLAGASAADRLAASEIGFMEVPFWKSRGEPGGEIVGLLGFAVPASAAAPEGAVALADAYLTDRSLGNAQGGYWLPIQFDPKDGEDLPAVQSRALSRTKWVFPSPDRILSAQFIQGSLRAWASFFKTDPRMSGADLAQSLQASRMAVQEPGGSGTKAGKK
jgi:ABC-type glycerol-3-phosphate transport system substrate-binding protein